MQCSPMWRPSISSATRLIASSAVDRQAASCAAVSRTNRRLTALLLVPRTRTAAPTGSKLRPYCRVATPRSICSTTRRFNGSVSANALNVGRATSALAERTRGRRICTFRPPRTTSLVTVPARDAARSGSCAYRGPQIAVRSASSIVVRTLRPDATASHQLGPRIDEEIDEGQMALERGINLVRPIDCARLSFHGGSLLGGRSPWLVTGRIARPVRSRRFQISTTTGTTPLAGRKGFDSRSPLRRRTNLDEVVSVSLLTVGASKR